MQNGPVKLLDVVALLAARPQDGLAFGQVGTVVELHSPEAFEVEFLDSQGRTISLATLKRTEILAKERKAGAGRCGRNFETSSAWWRRIRRLCRRRGIHSQGGVTSL